MPVTLDDAADTPRAQGPGSTGCVVATRCVGWQDPYVLFVRFEAAHPTDSGRRPGVFGLANGLARSGRLTDAEKARWRANNDWFEAACTDPATVDATLFDRTVHDEVRCWFKSSATHLLARVPTTLQLLDEHGIRWVERRSSRPGQVLYEDAEQVVVVPAGATKVRQS
jgi:hypothetical protein